MYDIELYKTLRIYIILRVTKPRSQYSTHFSFKG